MSYLPTDEEICSTFYNFYENTVSNIPAIEHFHSNLQNNDPILATVNSYDKVQVLKELKIGHAIRRSVSEKPILKKLVKSLKI